MKNKGFTIIELLVTMVILGLVLSGAMGAYYVLLKARDRVEIEREMQQEVTFAMTRVADKIRAHSVDYNQYLDLTGECYNTSLQGGNEICLGENRLIKFDTGQNNILFGTHTNTQPLFSTKKFNVSKLIFYTTPQKNPYAPSNLSDATLQLQPKVQVYLEIESKRTEPDGTTPLVKMNIQSTLSSRQYQ